jgi:ribosomal protein L14E/L6E/L27E
VKTDLTLAKNFKVSMGYSNITPFLSMSVKDVDIENVEKAHTALETIADILIHKQIKNDSELLKTIQDMGLEPYMDKIDMDEMNVVLKDSVKDLKKIGG